MKIENCHNVDDLRRAARNRAHRMVFDYIDGAADDEVAIRNNHRRFGAYDIVHRVLTGAEQINLSTTVLGHRINVPFFLSPSAGNRLFHKEGERAVAAAAAKAGTIYSLSTLSTVSIEEIGALTNAPVPLQIISLHEPGRRPRSSEAGCHVVLSRVVPRTETEGERRHRDRAADTQLENVRIVAVKAAMAWGNEALIAERREARHAQTRETASIIASQKEQACDEDRSFSENPDRSFAER